ncbi:hypothetical protein SALBM135S_07457 [Streptomyces alboniger]
MTDIPYPEDAPPSAGGRFVPPSRFAVPGRIAVSERAASRWQRALITGGPRGDPERVDVRLKVPEWEGHLPGQT